MTRDEAVNLLRSNSARIRREFSVRGLSLFGSYARNTHSDKSDVDVLVDFDGPATFDRFMELKFFLERLLGRPVDLVTRRAVRPRIAPSIQRDAIHVA